MRIRKAWDGAGMALFVLALAGCDPDKIPTDPGNPGGGPPHGAESPVVDTFSAPIGVSWLNPKPQDNDIKDIHFPDSRTGYLVGDAVILKTEDAGRTFLSQGSGVGQLNAVRFFDADAGIAVGQAGLIMWTADGGKRWDAQHVGSSALKGLCVEGKGRALAVGDFGTLLASEDGGKTWALKNGGGTEDLWDCGFRDAETVVATAPGLLLRSRDGGNSWTRDSLKDIYGNKQQILPHAFGFAESGIWYALNWGSPAWSQDSGKHWNQWSFRNTNPPPTEARDLAVTVAGMIYLVGTKGYIARARLADFTPEDGAPWMVSDPVTPSTLWALDFPSPDTGFAAGDLGEIFRTVDGGKNWTAQSVIHTRDDLAAVDFVDTLRGMAVGAHGAMLKTEDGGATWDSVAGAAARDLKGVHFLDAKTGCVVGVHGTALWTTDGGKTWSLGGTGTDDDLTGVRLIDAATAYAGGQRSLIKTLDGGKTWSPVARGELGYSPAWQVGDGLLFDGKNFHDSAFAAMMDPQGSLTLRYRPDPDSAWKIAGFPGRSGRISGSAETDSSLIYAVGGSTFFRIDAKAKTLRFGETGTRSPLRGISCPDAGLCFTVGDRGVILKIRPR